MAININLNNWNETNGSQLKKKVPSVEVNNNSWNDFDKRPINQAAPSVDIGQSSWNETRQKQVTSKLAPVRFEQTDWDGSINKEHTSSVPVISVEPSNWSGIDGIQTPKIIRHFTGINTLDPFSIEDNMMVINKNISTSNFPAAKVRQGTTVLSTTTGATHGMGAWKGTEIHAVSGGVWRKWNGTAWTTLLSGLNATKKWAFSNFKGNFADIGLIGANGVDPVKVYTGTTVTDLANAPATMNYIVGHENRLYGAVKNALHYSGLRLPTDWNTVGQSGQLVIENNGGENITSVVNGTGKIVVFMKTSMHELYGTGPINYTLQLVTEGIGCVSHQSVASVGGTMFFLSTDGLYKYGGGSLPSKTFSLPVQAIIDRVNPLAWETAVAGTDSERYYISLPIDGATTPNITLEYDPKFETWNVWDYGYTPTAYTHIEETMYLGFAENRIVKVGGTTSDNGVAIPYSLETKPFAYGSLASHNRLYRLWVVADIPVGSTMNVWLSNDKTGNTWSLVKAITLDQNITTEQVLIPVDKSFYHNWVRVKIEGTGPVAIHELTRQERTFQLGLGGM